LLVVIIERRIATSDNAIHINHITMLFDRERLSTQYDVCTDSTLYIHRTIIIQLFTHSMENDERIISASSPRQVYYSKRLNSSGVLNVTPPVYFK